jgi:hypothetical protein
LYVTVRRDELSHLKAERDQLKKKVAQMTLMLQHAQLAASGTALQA